MTKKRGKLRNLRNVLSPMKDKGIKVKILSTSNRNLWV